MMIIRPEDVIHKVILLRLLTEIADTKILSQSLYFKGGTCASMLGYIDRFSVDLDFDVKPGSDERVLRQEWYRIFSKLGLRVDDESKKALEFFLKYESPKGARNTVKVDALNQVWKANRYESRKFFEIDRMLMCQTKETIVSNKLVAPLDRWKKHKRIAGRDIYDIHYFLSHGYRYIPDILSERTGVSGVQFFEKLIVFIRTHVNQRIITEDLNTLLPPLIFQQVRKTLIQETLVLLEGQKKNAPLSFK